MINYFFKADLQAGQKDFLKFVAKATNQGVFSNSIDFAKKYLIEIEEKLNQEKGNIR